MIGLPEEVNEEFPSPGSNRGIEPSAYVRTLPVIFLREGATLRWFARSRRIGAFTPWLTSARCPVPVGIGSRNPCCSHVKFRPGNASPQIGIEEAIRHTLELETT